MLVSAALIVKNEAAFLSNCLQSIRPLVDDIVIVDTGSTDDSRDIARAYGARLFEHPWQKDFSAPRNDALANARGEWILYIDADEKIESTSRADVESVLEDGDAIGATVQFTPQLGFTPYREYRLFRNDPGIRFQGIIHETMLPDLMRVAREQNKVVKDSNIRISHFGYEGDQRHKHIRNRKMLERQLVHEPDRVYSWNHLGRVLEGLGEPARARQAWLSGIEAARKSGEHDHVDSLPYTELIRIDYLAGRDIGPWVEEALALFPENWMVRWGQAHLCMQRGQFAAAAQLFLALTEVDVGTYVHTRLAFDKRIFREFAYAGLGYCHFRLRHFDQSALFYGMAEQERPDGVEYGLKRRLAQSRSTATVDINNDAVL